MNRSLSKVLARMAKDGDIDTVAEIIGEMIEPAEAETEAPVPAETETPETGEEPAEAPVVEKAENVIAVDAESMAGLLERLDRIIRLLEPTVADEDAEAEIAGFLGEMTEAAVLGREDPMAGEISAVLQEILEPESTAFPETDEEEKEIPEALQAGDALRSALRVVRPVLMKMPRKQRRRVAGDIAYRMRELNSRRTADDGVYAALASACSRTAPASAELGKRIMEKRNSTYRKSRAGL